MAGNAKHEANLPMNFSTRKRGMGAQGNIQWFFVTSFFVSLLAYLFYGLMYSFAGHDIDDQNFSGPTSGTMYALLGIAIASLLLGTLIAHPTYGVVMGKCYRPKPKGPLAGVKVLDFSVVIAGPFAGQLMSEMGAEVIKVESMGNPDSARGFGNSPAPGLAGMMLHTSRGKQSVILNLKSRRGVEVALAMAKECDVLLQNFRPGATERMGLSYEAVRKVNPDIIYVSISGFGQTGPYNDKRVYDPLVQCIASIPHHVANEDGEARVGAQLVLDKLAGMSSAQAIASALVVRDRGGGGQHIESAMIDATMAWMMPDNWCNKLWMESEAPEAPRVHETALASSAAGETKRTLEQAKTEHQGFFETIACSSPLFPTYSACKHPITYSGTPVGPRPGAPMLGEHTAKVLRDLGLTPTDVRSLTAKGDIVTTPSLMKGMAQQAEAGGDAAAAAKAAKGAKAFGFLESFQSGPTFDYTYPPPKPEVEESWTESVWSGDATAGQGPMSGIIVVDLCSLLAGSMAAGTLADQGADCIKVELSSKREDLDEARFYGQQPSTGVDNMGSMFMAVNKNKRGMTLDYRTENGKAALMAILAQADVVFVDAREEPGNPHVDKYVATGQNPGLVFVEVLKGGGEFAVQAQAGASEPNAEGKPAPLKFMWAEKYASVYTATAAAAALFARDRVGGRGQIVTVDMLHVAMHHTCTDLFMNMLWKDHQSLPPFPTIATIYGALLATCKDGLKVGFCTVSDPEVVALTKAYPEELGEENCKSFLPGGELSTIAARMTRFTDLLVIVKGTFAKMDRDDAITRGQAAGVPLMRLNTPGVFRGPGAAIC
jgi:crotonobetainyl-CoA:carnitine CoA-transferase CaiB-like acyl-CoA transferase